MCDQNQLAEFARRGLNRRAFTGVLAAGGGAAVLSACSANGVTAEAEASGAPGGGVVASEVAIPADGGTIGGWFYRPGAGSHPAVIMWPDIAGVRPASKAMGERLAAEGFAVIVPDPYWRSEGHATFDDFADFAQNGGFETVKPYRDLHSPQGVMADTRAIAGWLDAQDAVDSARGIAARGHCMTGSWTVYAAKGSQRVTAAASMHGGGLVTDAPTSPHRMIDDTAAYLFAIAQNDDAKEPDAKTALKAALDASPAQGTVAVYPADHGWTVPDSPAYDKAQAELAYGAFLAMANAL